MEWKARDEYDYKEPKAPLSEAWVLASKEVGETAMRLGEKIAQKNIWSNI